MSAFGTKEEWIRTGLAAVLASCIAVGAVLLYTPSQPVFDQDLFLRVVREEMSQVHKVTETKKQESGEGSLQRQSSRNTVVERYNAQGQVTYRRTSNSTSNTQAQNSYQVVEAVKQEVVATQVARIEETASSSVKVPDAVVRRQSAGLGIGMMATSRGIGPAATVRIIQHDRISLDGVAGLSNGSPKAGVGVSAEVLPNLHLGANVLISPQDENIQLTHPLVPLVGITPGLTLQYRF